VCSSDLSFGERYLSTPLFDFLDKEEVPGFGRR
jgi:hypothetical protein